MTSIQRYDAWPQEWPFEAEDGDLVTYEDHRKIVEELEAKLAKAVDALEFYGGWSDGSGGICGFDGGSFASTTLAELKGQDDAIC